MGGFQWILGGLLGAAVGVAVWVLVGYFAHYEIGWIAWATGFSTGFGVRYAAYLGDDDASFFKGVLAAGMAVAAVITAKYVVFSLLVGGQDTEVVQALVNKVRFDKEGIIAGFAGEATDEAIGRGETIAWPPGVTPETAAAQKDFPPKVWQQAETRWTQLGPQKQEQLKLERMMLSGKLSSLMRKPDFGNSFSPWDLLWLGLAVVTAYKIGAGTYGSE